MGRQERLDRCAFVLAAKGSPGWVSVGEGLDGIYLWVGGGQMGEGAEPSILHSKYAAFPLSLENLCTFSSGFLEIMMYYSQLKRTSVLRTVNLQEPFVCLICSHYFPPHFALRYFSIDQVYAK